MAMRNDKEWKRTFYDEMTAQLQEKAQILTQGTWQDHDWDVLEAVSAPTQKMQKRGDLWWPKMTRSSEQTGENTAGDVQASSAW